MGVRGRKSLGKPRPKIPLLRLQSDFGRDVFTRVFEKTKLCSKFCLLTVCLILEMLHSRDFCKHLHNLACSE